MEHKLQLYNSMTRRQEQFIPINSPFAGMYVCGPTVYSDTHLGHARPGITFDILYRWLMHLGYRVRYVRNITDVGHLENEETDSGEDKIARKARLENIEPMEVVQRYMNSFHKTMTQLNTLPPSIEPRASGHIIEQQEMIRQIAAAGYAYESNGSVYFDVVKYNEKYKYGKLSGRVLEELISNSRDDLEGSEEKRSPFDFALWKKASPEHIMKWPSEWSEGFPGWHLECSAMSTKYLGESFDIHGGGMDLKFPHHECEIAQSSAALGHESVRYWVHNNMITINGQKMARSLGNFITLDQLFTGNHPLLTRAFSPMTIRFFILQAHYRSTLDFSDEALQAASKGLKKLMSAMESATALKASDKSTVDVESLRTRCYDAMNNDLGTPQVIATLFEAAGLVNSIASGKETINTCDLEILNTLFTVFITEVLGLLPEEKESGAAGGLEPELIELVLSLRQEAKERKDWAKSDAIRDHLEKMGVKIKDRKDGADWERVNTFGDIIYLGGTERQKFGGLSFDDFKLINKELLLYQKQIACLFRKTNQQVHKAILDMKLELMCDIGEAANINKSKKYYTDKKVIEIGELLKADNVSEFKEWMNTHRDKIISYKMGGALKDFKVIKKRD